tara:strand:- start:192 stop:746 length:555 start_codon:yes stop_codon:yes gene_type:complete
MRTLGYIRCSTQEQKLDRQFKLFDLCDHVYQEHGVSAVSKRRPVYDQVMNDLSPGDTFVVTSIDRVYRSTCDATTQLERLHQANIHFKCLAFQLDTRTPDGKLFYDILAAMAEWERRIISSRTKEGLEVARAKGKTFGRPKKLNEKQIGWARNKIETRALSNEQIAKELGVSQRTILRYLQART